MISEDSFDEYLEDPNLSVSDMIEKVKKEHLFVIINHLFVY
jgi:hypothetical protein